MKLKMNAKIVLSTVALAAVIGGSVLSYNQIYADKNDPKEIVESALLEDAVVPPDTSASEINKDVVPTNEEIKAPTIEGGPFYKVDLANVETQIPLELANDPQQKVRSSNGNEIVHLAEVRGLDDGQNLGIIAYYVAAHFC